jgi:hypothetical protein
MARTGSSSWRWFLVGYVGWAPVEFLHNPIDPRVSGQIFRGGRKYFPRTLEIPWRLEQSLCVGHFDLHPGCFSPLVHSEVRTSHTSSLYPTRSLKL